MKPHEETWVAGTGAAGRFVFDTEGNALAEFAGGDPSRIPAQVRLAAKAPEMARLLLKVLTVQNIFINGEDVGRKINAVLCEGGVL